MILTAWVSSRLSACLCGHCSMHRAVPCLSSRFCPSAYCCVPCYLHAHVARPRLSFLGILARELHHTFSVSLYERGRLRACDALSLYACVLLRHGARKKEARSLKLLPNHSERPGPIALDSLRPPVVSSPAFPARSWPRGSQVPLASLGLLPSALHEASGHSHEAVTWRRSRG